MKLFFDHAQHDLVPDFLCDNGRDVPCETLGHIRHVGRKFSSDQGLPVTANADVAGLVGGFGWRLDLDAGSPQTLRIELVEVKPDTPLLLFIPYPLGTDFTISAHARSSCRPNRRYSCAEEFQRVNSVAEVRSSLGNTYYVDETLGLLVLRVIQTPAKYVGRPDWFLPTYDDVGKSGKGYALPRFERRGVVLPKKSSGPWLQIVADCKVSSANPAYCAAQPEDVSNYNVCPDGYDQLSYDRCCDRSNPSRCIYADGTTNL